MSVLRWSPPPSAGTRRCRPGARAWTEAASPRPGPGERGISGAVPGTPGLPADRPGGREGEKGDRPGGTPMIVLALEYSQGQPPEQKALRESILPRSGHESPVAAVDRVMKANPVGRGRCFVWPVEHISCELGAPGRRASTGQSACGRSCL